MAIIEFASARPANYRPIRTAEWCGSLILAIRLAADGSRADLARLTGISANTIRNAELDGDAGRMAPAPTEAIARVFEGVGFIVCVPDIMGFRPATGSFVVTRVPHSGVLSAQRQPSSRGRTKAERNRMRLGGCT